jgi:hypothetical protein
VFGGGGGAMPGDGGGLAVANIAALRANSLIKREATKEPGRGEDSPRTSIGLIIDIEMLRFCDCTKFKKSGSSDGSACNSNHRLSDLGGDVFFHWTLLYKSMSVQRTEPGSALCKVRLVPVNHKSDKYLNGFLQSFNERPKIRVLSNNHINDANTVRACKNLWQKNF